MPPLLRPFVLVAVIVVNCASSGARAAEQAAKPAMDALEVMADLTLIDGACRDVVVNFGAGFRFAASRGIPDAAILPGGSRRSEFESVLQARQVAFGAEELCGQIAKNYMEALPASITPLYRRAEARP